MPRRFQGVLVAAAAVAGGALQTKGNAQTTIDEDINRNDDVERTCFAEDEVAYARTVRKVCSMNWNHHSGEEKFFEHMREGCWELKHYNTDNFMSSGVYRNMADGRCNLVLSGYHGAIRGYVTGSIDLSTPPVTWNMCGNRLWAPFVRLFRHHTSLANWTNITHYLGPGTECKGDLMVTGESMGGAIAEILAVCASSGHIDQLQAKDLPVFQINSIYTFGSIASSATPITNPQRPDGCFRGKRVVNALDVIGHLGTPLALAHAKMDTIEIFSHSEANPTFKVHPCTEKGAAWDPVRDRPANLQTDVTFTNTSMWKKDLFSHMATSYEAWLSYFREAGYGRLVEADIVDVNSTVYKKASAMSEKAEEESKAEARQPEPAPQEPAARRSKSAAPASHEWLD